MVAKFKCELGMKSQKKSCDLKDRVRALLRNQHQRQKGLQLWDGWMRSY